MKFLIILGVLFSIPCFSLAQIHELRNQLNKAVSEVENVDTEKYRYEQSLTYDQEKPWRITVVITEINQKNDKAETNNYYFNLADINPRLISIETDKDEQLVVLKARRRQDLIRLTSDNDDVSYESDLQLWSPEIDRATAIEGALKAAAELAEPLWKADFSPGTTLTELNNWLGNNVVSGGAGEQAFEVSWESDTNNEDLVILTHRKAEEEETTVSRFSMADLAKNSPVIGTRKGEVTVSLQTINKESLIQQSVDDEIKGYERDLVVPFSGIEEAKKFMASIEAGIPLAKIERKKRNPNPNNLEEALAELKERIDGEISNVNKVITVNLSAFAEAKMIISEEDLDKGESETTEFIFNFGDLVGKQAELKVKGFDLSIVVPTVKKKDFVQSVSEDESTDFSDEIVFPMQDVEGSFQVISLLHYITSESAKLPIEKIDQVKIQSIVQQGSEEDVTRSLKINEECKWDYTVIEEGKNTDETVYEFNLYDLDPKQIDYIVKGKQISLELYTRRKEETINVFENDEPKFTETMQWRIDRLADAKSLKATLIELVEGCSN